RDFPRTLRPGVIQGSTMNDEARCAELLTFEDSAQSVTVNVMWDNPTVMGEERYYTAEIVLQSAFVSGRVGLQVSLADLDDWGRCLDSLEARSEERRVGK